MSAVVAVVISTCVGCGSSSTATGTAGGTAQKVVTIKTEKPTTSAATGNTATAVATTDSTTAVASAAPVTNAAAASISGTTPAEPTAATPAKKGPSAEAVAALDKDYQPYASVQGVSGSVKSVGSDTMNNLMTHWFEGFKSKYPSVQTEMEGKGSGTAPPALIQGTAAFGPMSRPMKESEIAEFEKHFGYKPTALETSIDVLAVFVHKDNPIANLTLQQLDAIFSKTRKGGFAKDAVTWGDLGVTGEWASQPIRLYGRDSSSGTYGFFKEHVLLNGDFKDTVQEQKGSSTVVQKVGSDKWGIGYSGIGYITSEVKAIPLAANSGEPPVEPSAANGKSGAYPLTRSLLVYMNHKPGTALDPLRREFVRYIFSRDGQLGVLKDNYIPATKFMAEKALKSIGVEAAN